MFPLGQWRIPQILAITEQEIERHEPGLAASEEKIAELWLAFIVQGHDLTINNAGPKLQLIEHALVQGAE